MESAGFKPKIPRLFFPSVKDDQESMSFRSYIDDFKLTTSVRDQTDEKNQENLEDQIDRLNEILESMIGSVNKANEASSSISKITDQNSKNFCVSEDSSVSINVQQKNNLLEYINRLQMKIQDLESMYDKKNQLNTPEEIKQDIENSIQHWLDVSKQHKENSKHIPVLEQTLNYIKSYSEDFSFDIPYTKKVPNQIFSEDSLNQSDIFESRINTAELEIKNKELEHTIQIYKQSIASMCQDISNLTSKTINFTGNNIEIELPLITNDIIKTIGHIICKETELNIREKSIPAFNLTDKLKVACTYDEVIEIQDRIKEIVLELSEYGTDMDYTIKVGLLNIGINVYFPDDYKSMSYCLPFDVTNAYGVHQPDFQQRSQSLLRAKSPVCQAITQRDRLQDFPDTSITQQLQDQILELNRKLINQQEIKEMEEEMNIAMQNTANIRIQELENLIETQQYQLHLAKKQLELYQNGVNIKQSSNYVNYTNMVYELKEKENFLKNEHQKIEIEKQKIFKQTVELYCAKKQKNFAPPETTEKESRCSDDEEYCTGSRSSRSVDEQYRSKGKKSNNRSNKSTKSSKCDRDRSKSTDKLSKVNSKNINCKKYRKSTENSEYGESMGNSENYQDIESSENCRNSKSYPTRDIGVGMESKFKEEFSQTSPQKTEEIENLDTLNMKLNETYSKLEDLNCQEDPQQLVENIRKIKKKINDIQTQQALRFTEKSIDYAGRKLEIIEKELKKTSKMNSNQFEIKDGDELEKKYKNLEKALKDLQNLLSCKDSFDTDSERSKLIKEKIIFQQQKQKFDKKRELLKHKILQVNDRQKKIIDLEEALKEKKVSLSVQLKKQECFKQAIEEEWERIDKKRQDVLKCKELIDEQWNVLIEESQKFETLKKENQCFDKSHRYYSEQVIEKLSALEENALKVEIQHNQVQNTKKKLAEEKNKINAEWDLIKIEKNKLELIRKDQQEKYKGLIGSKEIKIEKKNTEKQKNILKENKQYLNSLGPKTNDPMY